MENNNYFDYSNWLSLHQLAKQKEITGWIINLIKEDKIIKFYQSKIWKYKKLEIWKRDNYECQECKKQGLVVTKKNKKLDIHHIQELKQHPEQALEDDNLVTVCVHHHNILDNKNNMAKPKLLENEERW